MLKALLEDEDWVVAAACESNAALEVTLFSDEVGSKRENPSLVKRCSKYPLKLNKAQKTPEAWHSAHAPPHASVTQVMYELFSICRHRRQWLLA